MREQFRQWLLNQGKALNTTINYASYAQAVAQDYSRKTGENTVDVYSIDDVVIISEIARQYGKGGDYEKEGEKNSAGWRNAIARYAEFVADLKKESAASAEDGVRVSDAAMEENHQNLKYEADLQNVLCSQISALFPGHKMLGREYAINGKRIDVLLEHGNSGDLLVVELKAGRADFAVFGQISMYMGMLQQRQQFSGKKIRGVIIAGSADEGLLYACHTNTNISVKFYRMTLELENSDMPEIDDEDAGE